MRSVLRSARRAIKHLRARKHQRKRRRRQQWQVSVKARMATCEKKMITGSIGGIGSMY